MGTSVLEPCGRSVHDGLLKVNRDLNVPVGSSPNVDYGTTGSYARIVETLSPKSEPGAAHSTATCTWRSPTIGLYVARDGRRS